MKSAMIVTLSAMLAFAGCSRFDETAVKAPPASATAPAAAAQATDTIAPATGTVAGVDVGATMPAYEARKLEGGSFDVAAERGNVLLLNVWATWCGPCRYEIPELGKLHAKYAAQRFKVIGVSIDEGDEAAVKKFVAENEVNYPVVLDPEAKLASLFETSVLPTTVLLDRQGKIVWKKYGAIEAGEAELARAIEMAIRG